MQVKFVSSDKSGNDANQTVPQKSGLFKLVYNNNNNIIIAEMASSNAMIFRWKILPPPVDLKRLYNFPNQ